MEPTEAPKDSWTSYPKIYALGHASSKFRQLDECIIEEKIDGSQFSFGVFDGEVRYRSRSVQLHERDLGPGNQFGVACAVVDKLAAEGKLVDGYTYRGEYLSKPKHNCLKYDRVPEKNIILFDVATGPEEYAPRGMLEDLATAAGLEVVPVLHRGQITAEELFALVKSSSSCLGGMVEGVVLKARGKLTKNDGKPEYAKYVSESFKEVNKSSKPKGPPVDAVQAIAGQYMSQARWQKAIYRLRDEGKLEHSPRDIGAVIKEIQRDLLEEEGAVIKQQLFDAFGKTIMAKAVSGFPEWYKQQLAKDALPSLAPEEK